MIGAALAVLVCAYVAYYFLFAVSRVQLHHSPRPSFPASRALGSPCGTGGSSSGTGEGEEAPPRGVTCTVPRMVLDCMHHWARAHAFWPVPWLVSGHAQSIALAVMRPRPFVEYRREVIPLSDGGELALDWDKAAEDQQKGDKPIVMILHGMNGGSRENYIMHFVIALRNSGMIGVVTNYRGAAGSKLLTGKTYSAGGPWDFREAVKHVHENYPNRKLAGVGYSLGSNILTNYVCEEGASCVLTCAISVSNPYDLVKGSDCLNSSPFRRKVYEAHLARGLVKYGRRHEDALRKFHPTIDADAALHARTVLQFDAVASCNVWGYKNPAEYYKAHSCIYKLPQARIPLLLLSAADDPMIPQDSLNDVLEMLNKGLLPSTIVAVTKKGGHCGWIEWNKKWDSLFKPRDSWADGFCCEFIRQCCASYNQPQGKRE
ncbi:AB-hydrolase YheT [Pelomyxa schiedti]|nr:AB-hydrolase YheT [Pelomyxa schiedti]